MLKIHFLNVGHGDCCVIEFPERLAVIDINCTNNMDKESINELLDQFLAEDEKYKKVSVAYGLMKSSTILFEKGYNIQLTDPVTYIENISASVFRFIVTHPHMDHLTGINDLSQKTNISNIWTIKNDFQPQINDLTDAQKEDWQFYEKYRDADTNVLDGITIVRPLEGDSKEFWNADGITILAPNNDLINEAKESNNPNVMSYVLLIKYGECKIILGGDAEESTWECLTKEYEADLSNVTILKASHHGRDSGYYQPAVKLMSPEYTIVSVGKKPDTDASNKYRTYSDYVYSTRWKGNIVFECFEDGKVNCFTEYDR